MVNDKQRQNTQTGTSFILPWAWAILIVLVLVFARDINAWAVSAETPLQEQLQPAALRLLDTAETMGVASTRAYVQSAVQGMYSSAPQWAGVTEVPVPEPKPVPVVSATPEVPPVQTIAENEKPVSPSKPRPAKILIIGDSSIQAGLGTELERRLEKCDGVTVMRFGLHSTGLARPDYFNWMDKLTELKADFDPDLTIAYFGDNDCQGLASVEGSAVAKFGTDEWKAEYGNRVEEIVGLMKEGGNYGAMVGMPIMRSKRFSNQMEILNGVLEEATLEAGGVFLPTWGITSDDEGKYMSSVEFEGKDRMIRQGDGIHLSEHGADYVAYHLIEMLKRNFTLIEKPE